MSLPLQAQHRKPRLLILFAVLSIVVQCVIWMSARGYDPGIAREHGPMEVLQTLWIFLGLICLLFGARKSKVPGSNVLFGGMALLYFSFLMLEIDFRKFTPEPLLFFLKGSVRDLWLGILWLGFFWAFLRDRLAALKFFRSWLQSSAGLAILTAGSFWVLGGVFDKAIFKGKNLFAEELMEVNAAFFMLISACFILVDVCRRKPAPSASS